MQADDGVNEDTLVNAKRELKKSEEGLRTTQEIVAHARQVASSLAHERETNHWAVSIYQNWAPGAGRHTA